MFGLNAPAITLAQMLAAATWVAGQLVAMGVMDNDTNQVVLSIATTAISAAWAIADAVIRQGRAKAAGLAAASGVSASEISKNPTS